MTLFILIILAALAFAVNPSPMGAGAAVLIVILVSLGQRQSQKINPYYLYLSTPISLLLYSDSISTIYLPPIDWGIQLIILGAAFSYLAGLLTMGGGGRNYKAQSSPPYSFYLILCLGLIPYAAGIVTTGLPLLSSNVNAARETFFLPIIGQFAIFLPVSLLVAFQRQDRFFITISIILNAFMTVMVVSRFSIFFAAIFLFYGYLRYDGRSSLGIRPAYLIFMAVVSIPFLFEAVFAARETGGQLVYDWRQQIEFRSVILNKYDQYTFLPYLYLTMPWSNFAYLFEVPIEPSYGMRSIYAVASFFQADSLLNFEPRPVRHDAFNTHAFPADFFLDFGVVGVILLSFFLGMLVKWSYIAAQRSSDLLQEAIWVTFGFASFLLFFSNHFTSLSYPLISLVFLQFYRLVRRSTRVRSPHQFQQVMAKESAERQRR